MVFDWIFSAGIDGKKIADWVMLKSYWKAPLLSGQWGGNHVKMFGMECIRKKCLGDKLADSNQT